SQQYEQRQRVASQLEQIYLEDYFGNEPLIVDFARELLLSGKRDGAKELNRMVKVVGGGVSSAKIIEQIEAEYLPQRKAEREERERVRKATKEADIARLRQRIEEENKKDAAFNKALYKFILIAGIVLASVIYFV
ncbi:MAG: hypothetical protein M1579_05200, partial [Gammaproteobacteria bacterium]|nr:hypothetical protein [Gammaproteobacteria bacterium]